MSSPVRQSDQSRSSPSRSRANGYRRSWKLGHEETAASKVAEELGRLYVDDERAFRRALDEQTLEQQKLHFESLRKSLARHEQVRTEAEQTIKQIELDLERQRIQRETEALRRQEEARQRLELEKRRKDEIRKAAERQRLEDEARAAEQKRNDEEEAKRRAELDRQKKEEARKASEKAAQDQAAAKKAAQDAKAAVDAEAQRQRERKQQQEQLAQQAQMNQTSQTVAQKASHSLPTGAVTTPDQRKDIHTAYMEIHKRLKQLRKQVFTLRTQDARFKGDVDNWRMKIKSLVGQVHKTDRRANRQGTTSICDILLQSLQSYQQFTVDVSQYLLCSPSTESAAQGSMLLVFLLNIFVKAIIGQLEQEVAPVYPDQKGDSAEQIGVMLVSVFAEPRFHYNGQSLIDICWAKYHHMCPYLFGVPMLEAPKNIKDNSALAAGFAAITLRNFQNHTTQKNPAPNRLYWEALARITNLPTERQKRAHYVCLASLLNHTFVTKFIKFYGKAAFVALRHALITFPSTAPRDKPPIVEEAKILGRMVEELDSKLHLKL